MLTMHPSAHTKSHSRVFLSWGCITMYNAEVLKSDRTHVSWLFHKHTYIWEGKIDTPNVVNWLSIKDESLVQMFQKMNSFKLPNCTLSVCMYLCTWVDPYSCPVCVWRWEKNSQAMVLFSQRGLWGSKPGYQAWQQCFAPIEVSYQSQESM